ncbi:hypothetical protein AAG906_024712 [Vitis piasezkii]
MLTTSTSPTMPSNNCDTPWYMDSSNTSLYTEFGNLIDPCVLTVMSKLWIKPRGRYFFREYLKMDSTKFHYHQDFTISCCLLFIAFTFGSLLNYPSIVLKPSSLSIIISYCGIID